MTLSIGWKAGEIRTVRSAQNVCCFLNTISSSQGGDTGADSGTAVLEYFQDKMPYGLAVPDVLQSLSPGFYCLEPGGRSSTH
jgi:hypothetical protein